MAQGSSRSFESLRERNTRSGDDKQADGSCGLCGAWYHEFPGVKRRSCEIRKRLSGSTICSSYRGQTDCLEMTVSGMLPTVDAK